jgi:hypothetical protein
MDFVSFRREGFAINLLMSLSPPAGLSPGFRLNRAMFCQKGLMD